MSGPVTMALGPFLFTALGFSYSETARKLDTSWAEIEVADRFAAAQWTGPRSEAFTISGVLFPEEFGGAWNLEGVREAAMRGETLMLVSIGGMIFGRHRVESVDEQRSFHDAFGAPRRNAYTLSLKRYQASGPGPSALLPRLF